MDATVAGALEVTNGRAVLVGNTTVTAKDHTAEIALGRGGKVLVCATSGLHVTAGKGGVDPQPLMLSLDRGAIEVHMAATTSDVVMTPDLRFAIQSAGPLDLRLRVTRYGDTCVENVGSNAPLLRIADQFGDASYELHAGQHVLFEHGNLKEVVDRESSPCGCPSEPVVSVAAAGTTSTTPAAPGSVVAVKQAAVKQAAAKQAEAEHPFPAAVSQGLAPSVVYTAAASGAIHTQVAATLTFNGANPASDANGGATNSSAPSATPNFGDSGTGKNAGAADNASSSHPAATAPDTISSTCTRLNICPGKSIRRALPSRTRSSALRPGP